MRLVQLNTSRLFGRLVLSSPALLFSVWFLSNVSFSQSVKIVTLRSSFRKKGTTLSLFFFFLIFYAFNTIFTELVSVDPSFCFSWVLLIQKETAGKISCSQIINLCVTQGGINPYHCSFLIQQGHLYISVRGLLNCFFRVIRCNIYSSYQKR